MSNKRLKLLLENFLFYGGLTALTKAFPLIMLPIITRLLPNASSYGIADMFNIISSFGVQIAILGIYDAMFREFFEYKEDENYKKKVTSTAFVIVTISSIILGLSICIFSEQISKILYDTSKYSYLVIISGFLIIFNSIQVIVQAPTRMNNQRKIFFWTGLGMPVINYILLILFIKKGFTFEAIIYSTVGSNVVFLIIFIILNYKNFSIKLFEKKIAKELLKIGIPLVPSFLVYWIFTSTDRIIISKFLGMNELGIYSVGVRVASVSQLIYTAFAGGWQYFAFSTMKDKDQVEMTSRIFLYLGIISYVVYVISLPFIKPVFNIMFRGEYQKGFIVFPYLFISPLILMLYQTISNQFLVIKKSIYSPLVLSLGAVVNLVLSYLLVPRIGIIGASVGTMLGYLVSTITSFILLLKLNQVVIMNKCFYLLLLSFIVTSILIYFTSYIFSFWIGLFLIIILLYNLKDEIVVLIKGHKK